MTDPGARPAPRYPGARILALGERAPRLHASAFVAPGAAILGDVTLGADSSVWYGCVLRGDLHAIRVGTRSNVQDLSVLHVTRDRFPTEVGDEVTIGHRAVVHGCTIGDGALIGIGAVILDGARVGEGALVGAGALVAPGTEVPARVLVLGVPARVVRPLSDEELASQRRRAHEYVETARLHVRALDAGFE